MLAHGYYRNELLKFRDASKAFDKIHYGTLFTCKKCITPCLEQDML